MHRKVDITKETTLWRGWATLRRYGLDVTRRDGARQHLTREVYDHGDAAAILLFNRALGTVVLTRQFRLPVHLKGDAAEMLEVCAGLLDGLTPEACAEKEAAEETGYRVHRLARAFDVYSSPGSVTEKVYLFVGEYEPGDTVSAGGGLAHEGEDVDVVVMAFAEAREMVRTGAITDAKTILLLQYAALEGLFDRDRLPRAQR